MTVKLPAPPSEAPAAPAVGGAAAEPGPADELAAALRPAWVDVDLDALEANLRHLRRTVGTRIAAVVKADAYGHGAIGVGRALAAAGVDFLAVALFEEGAELRRAGVEAPVLVLGSPRAAQLPLYRRYRLTPTVGSLAELALWRDASAGHAAPQPLHLKVDTGMSRLGIALGEVGEALDLLRRTPGLCLEGLLSHFAEADLPESPRNPQQEDRFAAVVSLLTAEERERTLLHMANSAAALHRPASRLDLVRIGIALYGIDPLGQDRSLRPVMAVTARVVQVREVPAGTPLSYGGRTVTTRPSRIAVVPVGYADGYTWRLTGRAEALLRGRRVPVAGSVTMDMTLLDATDTGVEAGEEAVLLGRQGSEEITAGELAGHAGTIAWEVLCSLGQRLPRRLLRGGRAEDLVSRFRRGGV